MMKMFLVLSSGRRLNSNLPSGDQINDLKPIFTCLAVNGDRLAERTAAHPNNINQCDRPFITALTHAENTNKSGLLALHG